MQAKPYTPPPRPSALAEAATQKGRGTVWALQHRFSRDERESFDDGWG
eukprot:gene57203-76388_t